MASTIRKERIRNELTLREVGGAMNRSGQWVLFCETGRLPVSAALEARILATIERLAAFNQKARERKAQLMEDLRLPRAGCSTR